MSREDVCAFGSCGVVRSMHNPGICGHEFIEPVMRVSDRHWWDKNDRCKRCGTCRSGYSWGRTGSMTYTSATGVVSNRAGRCFPARAEAPQGETVHVTISETRVGARYAVPREDIERINAQVRAGIDGTAQSETGGEDDMAELLMAVVIGKPGDICGKYQLLRKDVSCGCFGWWVKATNDGRAGVTGEGFMSVPNLVAHARSRRTP